jgi:hypothetical protein
VAIWFRALLAVFARVAKAAFLPVVDAVVIYAGFLWLLPYWEQFRYEAGYYPEEYMQKVVPVYILIWLVAVWLTGGYRKPIKIIDIFKGLIWGSIAILVFHSLVDESLRFSRALILLGSAWAFFSLITYRYLLSHSSSRRVRFDRNHKKRVVVIANADEARRIQELVEKSQMKINVVGLVRPEGKSSHSNFLGNLSQLEEVIRIHKIEELIFSASDLSSGHIINIMLKLTNLNVEYKIAPPESLSIIGSSSIDTAGELYVVQLNAITKGGNKRNKRLLDFFLSLFFLVSFPVTCWAVESKKGFLRNIFTVLFAEKSWVGFAGNEETKTRLPKIRAGIITPADQFNKELPEEKKLEIDMVYAKNYRILQDVELIFQAWKNLGR